MAQNGCLIMPVVYDGTLPWDQWLFLYEVAAEMNGWQAEPAKMANMLIFSMRGHALALCLTLDEPVRRDYEALKAKLTEVLCPVDTLDMLIAQLEQRRRQPEETLLELKVDIHKLVCKVYPGMEAPVLKKHARVAFLKSISATAYGEKTIDAQPGTLEEALAKAQFFEQRAQARPEVGALYRAPIPPQDYECEALNWPGSQEDRESLKEEVVPERRYKKKRPNCYKCGQAGHLKSNCPQKGAT